MIWMCFKAHGRVVDHCCSPVLRVRVSYDVLYCTVLYCTVLCTVLRARVSYDVMVRATRRENWYPATLRASLRRPANHGADAGHVTTADQSQAAAATSHIRCPNSKNFKHIYFNTSIISPGERIDGLRKELVKWCAASSNTSNQGDNWIEKFLCLVLPEPKYYM